MKKNIVLFLVMLAIGGMAHAQDSTYKEFVGRYKFPAGSVVEDVMVNFENGILNMNSSAGASVLEKIKGDTFNVVSFNGIAVFKRDDAKKVIGVHVDASGYVLDGEKEPAKLSDYTSIVVDEKQIKEREYIQELLRSGWRPQKPRIL